MQKLKISLFFLILALLLSPQKQQAMLHVGYEELTTGSIIFMLCDVISMEEKKILHYNQAAYREFLNKQTIDYNKQTKTATEFAYETREFIREQGINKLNEVNERLKKLHTVSQWYIAQLSQ